MKEKEYKQIAKAIDRTMKRIKRYRDKDNKVDIDIVYRHLCFEFANMLRHDPDRAKVRQKGTNDPHPHKYDMP